MRHYVIKTATWAIGDNVGILLACQCGKVVVADTRYIVERWDRHLNEGAT